jgi:hypothetical protein
MPIGFGTCPKEWSGTQILEFSQAFNSIMVNDPVMRQRIHFMPEGFKFQPMIERDPAENAIKLLEFIVRRSCAIFHVAPTVYTGQVNRATAEQAATSQVEQADEPLFDWVESIITREIQKYQGCPNLKLHFVEERAMDEMQSASRDQILVNCGIISIDEARVSRGLDPIGLPNGLNTQQGFTPLEGTAEGYREQYKEYFDARTAEQQAQQQVAEQQAAAATAALAAKQTEVVPGEKPAGEAKPGESKPGEEKLPFGKKPPEKKPPVEEEVKPEEKLAAVDGIFKSVTITDSPEKTAELNTWRRFVRNCIKTGKPYRPFVTQHLSPAIVASIQSDLQDVLTKGQTITDGPFVQKKRLSLKRDPRLEAIRNAVEARLQKLIAAMFADQRQAALRVLRREVEKVSKGDVPGHEFHGNQYTEGGGAGQEEEWKGNWTEESWKAEQERIAQIATGHKDQVEKLASSTAKKLGYPKDDITIASSVGYEFSVGESHFRAAGQYDSSNRQITLYAQSISNPNDTPGIVAHEIEHASFDQAQRAYQREYEDLIDRSKAAGYSGKENDPLTRGGMLKPERAGQFPAVAAMDKYQGRVTTDSGKVREKLTKEDGVSDYSRAYWKDYGESKDAVKFERACNETLAEMSRIKLETGKLPGTKVWRDYYRDVKKSAARFNALYKSVGNGLTKKSDKEIESTVFFTSDFKIVDVAKADFVKVFYTDGTVLIGQVINA